MPKIGAEPIRRAEAINSTLECICEYGIDNITIDMIAAKAGFSKGIIIYYFESKKKLIIESLKAFLASYKLKIGSSITQEMQPMQMLNTIVEVSLPRLDDDDDRLINVSTLEGPDNICLPQKKIAKIFSLFISRASIDEDIKAIVKDIYSSDVEGISVLMKYAMKTYSVSGIDDKKAAYTLLATILGLSFFRNMDFMPEAENDNREIAFDLINLLFGL